MDIDKLKDAAAGAADAAKSAASGAASAAKDAAGNVGEKLSGVGDFIKDEEKTDAVLDKAAEAANKATGGKFADQVERARDFADGHLGDERK